MPLRIKRNRCDTLDLFPSWFSALLYAIYQIFFNTVNGMASSILSSPPYNFSTQAVGLSYISCLIGCIPGSLFAGWTADKLTVSMARRHGGISEPEDKLLLLLPLVVLCPAGLLMMGLGPYYNAHWIVYVIGQGVVIACGPVGVLVAINYVFDCFHSIKPVSNQGMGYQAEQSGAPYLISLLVPTMVISFGANYGLTPWFTDIPLWLWAVSAIVILLGIQSLAILVWFFGKRIRRSQKNVYLNIIQL